MPDRSTPLVSVIIPFLNAEKYLEETIESVFKQEYNNWEIILVDDGSSDSSTNIAKAYASNHPGRIVYVEHEGHANKAAAASRNLGITKVKGDLVALLDADDLWLPQKLKLQVALFEQNPQVDMLCEASTYWYSWENPNASDRDVMVGAMADRLYYPPQLAKVLYPLEKGDAPCPCCIILKTSALKKINGFEECFVGRVQVYEDQAFLIKAYLNLVVYVSSQCNNLYRQHPASVMKTAAAQGNYYVARYFFLQWFESYLETEQINEPSIQKLLNRAFRALRFRKVRRIPKKILSVYRELAKSFG